MYLQGDVKEISFYRKILLHSLLHIEVLHSARKNVKLLVQIPEIWRNRPARKVSGLFYDDFVNTALRGAFALVFVQDFFSQPQGLGRGFDVFVRADVFEGALKGKAQGRV